MYFVHLNLLSFEFLMFFGAFAGLRARAEARIPDLPSFPLSVPPDVQTRGPDPLEPFLGLRTLFLGLCCLGATSCRHSGSEHHLLEVFRGALFGRRTRQAPRHWAPPSGGAQSSVWAPPGAGAQTLNDGIKRRSDELFWAPLSAGAQFLCAASRRHFHSDSPEKFSSRLV